MDNIDSDPVQASAHHLQREVNDSGSEAGNIIQDAQFFQDAVTEYQLAYQSLDEKYTHQAILVKEASEALKASEGHVTMLQEELMALKLNCNAHIQQALGQVVSQYEQQLTTEQSPVVNTSQQLHSCRDRYNHFRYLWPAKGIYLQWVQLKKT